MLELHLFGTPQVLQDSQDLTADVGAKSLALVSFLAIANSPVPRQKLAGTFWSDKTEEAARYRLRHALWDLNRLLPKEFIQSNDGNCWHPSKTALATKSESRWKPSCVSKPRSGSSAKLKK